MIFFKVYIYLTESRCVYSPWAPGNLATPLHVIDTNIYRHNKRTETKLKITYLDRLLYFKFLNTGWILHIEKRIIVE